MTVNELIAELQVLVAQGHGELDVLIENHDYAKFDKVTGVMPVKSHCYQEVDTPYVSIERD